MGSHPHIATCDRTSQLATCDRTSQVMPWFFCIEWFKVCNFCWFFIVLLTSCDMEDNFRTSLALSSFRSSAISPIPPTLGSLVIDFCTADRISNNASCVLFHLSSRDFMVSRKVVNKTGLHFSKNLVLILYKNCQVINYGLICVHHYTFYVLSIIMVSANKTSVNVTWHNTSTYDT